MNIKVILIISSLVYWGCSSKNAKEIVNAKDSFNLEYYNQLAQDFEKDIKSNQNIKDVIEKHFYNPDEIVKSENYEINIALESHLRKLFQVDSVLIFKNEEMLNTNRKLLFDSSFCDCNFLYTDLDTNMIFTSCYKYGKIYSIMPLWDGNKEMKITWLR